MADELNDDGLGGQVPEGAIALGDFDDEDEKVSFPFVGDEDEEADDAGAASEESAPAKAAEEEAPPAWQGVSEPGQRLISKKGWKGPDDALRSYAQLEEELGRVRSAGGKAAEPTAEMQAVLQQNQVLTELLTQMRDERQAAVQGEGLIDFEREASEPDFDLGRSLNYLSYDFIPTMVQGIVQREIAALQQNVIEPLRTKEIAPLRDVVTRDVTRRSVTEEAKDVKSQIGAELFLTLGTRAGEIYAENPGGMTLFDAFARAKMEHDIHQSAQAARDAEAGGSLTGGGGPRPTSATPDVRDEIRNAIKNVGRRHHDGL